MKSTLFRKKMAIALLGISVGLSIYGCATTQEAKPTNLAEDSAQPELSGEQGEDQNQGAGESSNIDQEQNIQVAKAATESAPEQDAQTAQDNIAEEQSLEETKDVGGQEQAENNLVDLQQRVSDNSGARKDFEDAVMAAGVEPARAMTLFARAAKEDPNFILAWHNAGVAAERQHKDDQAVAYYKKALALHIDFYPSLNSLMQLYLRKGQAQLARSLVQQVLSKTKTASTLTVAGQYNLSLNNVSEAERNAKAALKKDEKNVPAMLLLAEVFFAQKKYELSRFVLKNGKEIAPKNALIHQAMGRVLLAQKKNPAAIRAFEKAVSIRQDLPEAYNNLSVLYAETGDVDGSLSAGKIATQLSPHLAVVWENYANALRAKKMYKKAIAAYEKAIMLDKSNPDPAFNLGILYLDNPVGKLDIVQRMDMTLKYLEDYKARAQMTADLSERLDKYIKVAERLKRRELKRRERKAKRKAKDEAKKKAEIEAKKKAALEAKLKAQEEARKKAEEKARQEALKKAREHKLGGGGK